MIKILSNSKYKQANHIFMKIHVYTLKFFEIGIYQCFALQILQVFWFVVNVPTFQNKLKTFNFEEN